MINREEFRAIALNAAKEQNAFCFVLPKLQRHRIPQVANRVYRGLERDTRDALRVFDQMVDEGLLTREPQLDIGILYRITDKGRQS